eukprot:COSAG01_NODE_20201_length_965_cov_4.166282_2_plen_95_part_00
MAPWASWWADNSCCDIQVLGNTGHGIARSPSCDSCSALTLSTCAWQGYLLVGAAREHPRQSLHTATVGLLADVAAAIRHLRTRAGQSVSRSRTC